MQIKKRFHILAIFSRFWPTVRRLDLSRLPLLITVMRSKDEGSDRRCLFGIVFLSFEIGAVMFRHV